MANSADALEIIYDGECPYCSDYVRLLRLRENIGTVILSDARALGARGQSLLQQGFNLDDGMMVIYGGRIYFAGDAANILSMLSAPGNTLFVRLANWLVRSKARAAWGYPLLRTFRNIALRLGGKQKINAG